MNKEKVLIVDDSQVWVNQGRTLLEMHGYAVDDFVVDDPTTVTGTELPHELAVKVENAEVLLVDKDLGGGVSSTRLICVVREYRPNIPIIRWTGGYDDGRPYMRYLGVSCIKKPNRKNEKEFGKVFKKALDEQTLILSGPMGIFAALDESVDPDKFAMKRKREQCQQIAEIAQLAHQEFVVTNLKPEHVENNCWKIDSYTRHDLSHCICDGNLTADDIEPHLADLQEVIRKFHDDDEISESFKFCADFILRGDLDELELVRGC